MYIKSRVSQAYSHFRRLPRVHPTSHYYHTSKATVVDAKYFLPDKQSGWRGSLSRYEYAKRYLMDTVFKRLTNSWLGELHSKYKLIFRTYHPNNYYFKPRSNILPKNATNASEPKVFFATPNNPKLTGIQLKYEQTRRLLINNILRGVTNSLAADLRRRSERQLFNGNPRPFLALVGVSLASGSGIITKEDEFKGICWEIRESINRMRTNMYTEELAETDDKLSLAELEFGSVIAKGSNAVVYEAREKSKSATSSTSDHANEYPLAVKMMFNYDAESNAIAILRSMYREMVPLQIISPEEKASNFWEKEMSERIRRLPPHTNLVKMYRSFTDYVPDLPDSKSLYPDALPRRLNPQGFGRNMSLFIVMKKYKTDLKQYLVDSTPKVKEGILLLTQLLEAVTHFNKYQIAHRDLKSDNILLDLSDYADDCPLLVVTDFGCCLSDKYNGLTMPYKTPDIDRGGNAALMAPEVITAQAGMFSSIDYSKADVWTVGTIAYEIFTKRNPFYRYKNQTENEVLRNSTYTDDMLPELPTEVPAVISRLIHAILAKNPAKRMDAELAATICQVHLWAPSHWFTKQLPSNSEILQWLLSLTTKVLYEGPALFRQSESKVTSKIEFQLIATFLQRVNFGIVRKALNWINDV